MKRLFDHIDLRVRNLDEARTFYDRVLPALGFPIILPTPMGIAYQADRNHLKPEFIGLIADPDHQPNRTRVAFWADSVAEVNRIAEIAREAGARNWEGAAYCPEYTPTYYAAYFEDPSGNRLEVCYRLAPAGPS